jgi:hypothetical protein
MSNLEIAELEIDWSLVIQNSALSFISPCFLPSTRPLRFGERGRRGKKPVSDRFGYQQAKNKNQTKQKQNHPLSFRFGGIGETAIQ